MEGVLLTDRKHINQKHLICMPKIFLMKIGFIWFDSLYNFAKLFFFLGGGGGVCPSVYFEPQTSPDQVVVYTRCPFTAIASEIATEKVQENQ